MIKGIVVSCLMPTFSRQHLLPRAIALFRAQQRTDAELVVVSEEALPAPLMAANPDIRVIDCRAGLSLGEKRNLACEAARGDILVHWDDDDWQAPDRLARQLAAFARPECQVSGSSQVHFYEPSTARCWEYRYENRDRPWVCGATLAYRRGYWQQNPFADITVGEDNLFVWAAEAQAVHDHRDAGLCLCAIHAGNTSRKNTADAWWHPIALPGEWQDVIGRDSFDHSAVGGE
ncbi:MAG: hypothetical protein H6R14_2409 [Proteobacteria bacterium]|nr:hypothetical protein [Pseudomonadota bacterium]